MITAHSMKKIIGSTAYDFDLVGLSTDEKPSTVDGYVVGVNSHFLEADTGDFYYLEQAGEHRIEKVTYAERQEVNF